MLTRNPPQCPTASSEWEPTNDDLPAIPASAEKYMSTGAGTGPGLNGTGSQDAGSAENESTGTASAGSGSVTETASASGTSKSKSDGGRAQPLDVRAFSVVLVVMLGMVGGMVDECLRPECMLRD
jgi:hypothetical protein